MSNPEISVIIPTYNRKKVLQKAVLSVKNQTFKNWELLIVDDLSTDKTKVLINNKYKNCENIHFIERSQSRKKGANACRNIGIENAKGEFIAFLDSDDKWKPDHLKNCLQFAKNKKQFHGSYSNKIVKLGNLLYESLSRKKRENESYFEFLLGNGHAQTSTYFLKRNAAEHVRFNEELQRHQDYDFFVRFGEKFEWYFNPSNQVVFSQDLQKNYSKMNFNSYILVYDKYKDLIINPEIKTKYLKKMYLQSVISGSLIGKSYFEKELKKINYFHNLSVPHWVLITKFRVKYFFLFQYLKVLYIIIRKKLFKSLMK